MVIATKEGVFIKVVYYKKVLSSTKHWLLQQGTEFDQNWFLEQGIEVYKSWLLQQGTVWSFHGYYNKI
jgi:hypothetical protein